MKVGQWKWKVANGMESGVMERKVNEGHLICLLYKKNGMKWKVFFLGKKLFVFLSKMPS